MPDLSAMFAYAGNQTLDALIQSQREDPRYPLLLCTDPDIIDDAIIRAALVAAIQRLEDHQ